MHKDAIFNSVTVGCIPNFSSLINARASVCPVLMAWICSFDRAVRFRAHNTFAEQKVVALHPRQATEVSCCARCLFLPSAPHTQLQDLSSLCILVSCRKDTYGVFSEPVDPEEVCLL